MSLINNAYLIWAIRHEELGKASGPYRVPLHQPIAELFAPLDPDDEPLSDDEIVSAAGKLRRKVH